MRDIKLMTGRDLGRAICEHFGLSRGQVRSDFRIKTEPGELASINITINLTPDDLAGIARAAGRLDADDEIRALREKYERVSRDARRNAEEAKANAQAARKYADAVATELYKAKPDAAATLTPEARDTLAAMAFQPRQNQAQELKIKVDAVEAASLIKKVGDDLAATIRVELRNGVETLLDLAGRIAAAQAAPAARMVQGEVSKAKTGRKRGRRRYGIR